MSTLHVTIPQEQEYMLNQLASKEGQSIDTFVEQLLREGIERRYRAPNKTERLQALARIEEHRQAFLARRNQTPLNIEPTELLRQAREDRVDHLFNVLEEHMHDRG
ncbi:MAG: hypothetical protein GY801_22015 [bacterium]|nr:hypothetical protein [bacterium]